MRTRVSSQERAYNTSKAAREVLVGSILGGTNLNYVAHKGCVCRASADGRKQQELEEKDVISRRKELVYGAGINYLRQATDNGACLTAINYRLNITELSWEEFQDNLIIQYGIVNLNLPTECDGYGKKFLVPHNLSCPKGGLILARNNDAAKEWVALLTRDIKPSVISYEPKINRRAVQGESNRTGVRVAIG